MEYWNGGEMDAKRGSFSIKTCKFLVKPEFTIAHLSDILVL
jgi:hypothetical protein